MSGTRLQNPEPSFASTNINENEGGIQIPLNLSEIDNQGAELFYAWGITRP
jgi:hypothetical protein